MLMTTGVLVVFNFGQKLHVALDDVSDSGAVAVLNCLLKMSRNEACI